jgi:CHASE3 domain sensor protein
LQPVEATAIDAIARKTTTMRESASGYAATIAAISRLPEATQLRQLELDNELSSRELDLEKHRLDLMARDRSEKRAEKTQRILAATAEETKRIQGHRLETQRTELLNYIFASIGTLILLVLVFYLYVTGQSQVATPILSAAVAFGAGFAGGNGYAKRHYREPGRKGKESD